MAAPWPHQPYQAQQYQQQSQQYQQQPQQYQQQPQQYQQQPQQYQQPQYQQTQQYQQSQQYQQPQYQQQLPQHQQQAGQNQFTGQIEHHGQFQQRGQHNQHGQYQQPGQYSQYQQYQPYQQNRQYQTQHQGQGGYQQQYTPQQPSSQQYSPQQQVESQYAAYPQPNHHQRKSVPLNPQPCFNCGNPDHFAQDCPEPKRQVPAGTLEPHKFQNPLKRPRPGHSGFQAPPHPISAQAPPQGYAPMTQAQPSYPQQQYSPITPATPTSAQSPAQQQHLQQQWQQYYQWQTQQGNLGPQGDSQQKFLNSANPSQAVGHNIGYQQPGHVPPPEGFTNAPNAQMYHSQQSRGRSASVNPVQNSQQQLGTALNVEVGYRNQDIRPSSSMQSDIITQTDREVSEDNEEDDLLLLDIPNIPLSPLMSANVRLRITLETSPIKLISTPLPANSVVADALCPIASPAPELEGRCKSKYVSSADLDEEHENVEYSKYWNNNRDDPVFAEKPSDESTMSLDDALTLIKRRYVNGEAEDESSKSRSQSRSVSDRRESFDKASALANIEQNIAAEKAKIAARLAEIERRKKLQNGKHSSPSQAAAGSPPTDEELTVKEEQQASPQSANFGKPATSHEQNEAILAALGVTGSPKPVDTRPLPPYYGVTQVIPDSSTYLADTLANDHTSRKAMAQAQDFEFHPPHTQQSSHPGVGHGSPNSARSGHINAQSYNANGADYDNGLSNYAAEEYNQSPHESRSATSSSRKRSFAHRGSSSDEEDTPARRQENDIIPKPKRRQPKVAEAYGRRW